MFPASVPFLTTVGGTQVTSASNEKTMREIPCQSNLGSIITTGGGFSNYYSTPRLVSHFSTYFFHVITLTRYRPLIVSFQAKAVSTYTNTLNSRILNLINSNGRGYPDISLVSSAYTVVVADTVVQFSSTSAAAAVFAVDFVYNFDLS
jgi:tripeptidyl-peptidase-1